jgi:hypothetical protein
MSWVLSRSSTGCISLVTTSSSAAQNNLGSSFCVYSSNSASFVESDSWLTLSSTGSKTRGFSSRERAHRSDQRKVYIQGLGMIGVLNNIR